MHSIPCPHLGLGRLAEVLLIEDDSANVELVRVALKDSFGVKRLHVVQDGERALNFLFKKGAYTEVPCPDIVILDLNIPKDHGKDVLAALRKEERYRFVSVIVFSSSTDQRDIQDCYSLGASSYVNKPNDVETFLSTVQAIVYYWFSVVTLPVFAHS